MEEYKVLHKKTSAEKTRSKVLVPKLRFKDFEEPWQVKKLGNLVTIKSGNTPSNYELSDQGKFPFVKVEELNNNAKYQIKSRFYTNENEDIIAKDSIIFPKRGAAILNNKIRIAGKEILIDTNLMALKTKPEILNFEFLYYKIFNEKLFKIADCSTIPQINNKHIEPYKFPLPSLPEQEKIAAFLGAVDEKIQLLNRKKELLEQYKKGVMQQLFSGKLRFKDEKGKDYPKWEEKKLREVGKFNAGGDLDKLDHNKDKIGKYIYPIYANGAGEGLYGYATTFQYKSNCVTVSGRGNLGYANLRTQNFNAIVRLIVIEPFEFINSSFLKYTINNINFIIESTGVPQLTVPQISTYKIQIPCLEEQKKIADYLSALDKKLEQLNQQITQAQNFKKGLLQQMFV